MMFGRFTERAQKVLALAQEEAVRLGHNNIGTEHILLGLIREGEGIAAKALSVWVLGLEKIQDEVETLLAAVKSSRPISPIRRVRKKSLSCRWMKRESLAIRMSAQSIFCSVLFVKAKVSRHVY